MQKTHLMRQHHDGSFTITNGGIYNETQKLGNHPCLTYR